MANDINMQFRVPWEVTAALFASLIGLPLAGAAVAFLVFTHGSGTTTFGLVATAMALPFFIWAGFAIRSRIRKGRAAGEPAGKFIRSFLIAVGVLVLTVILF